MEFQAVLLAGSMGTALYPLCEETPPFLLPIATRPLLHFQLELLANAGFTECLLVTRTERLKTINACIEAWRYSRAHQSLGGVRSDAAASIQRSGPVLSPSSPGQSAGLTVRVEHVDQWHGTCAAIRHIAPLLTTDFFVIQSDLVATIELAHLADIHRSQQSALTMLLQDTRLASESKDLKKKKDEDENIDTHFIGLVDNTRATVTATNTPRRSTRVPSQRMVYYKSSFELDDEELKLNKSLLRSNSKLIVHTKLKDSHLYLFSHWLLAVILDNPAIVSVQKELVPYIVKCQFNDKLNQYRPPATSAFNYDLALRMSHSSPAAATTSASGSVDSYSCYVLLSSGANYCKRANSIKQYKDINTELMELYLSTPATNAHTGSHSDGDDPLPFMSLLIGENYSSIMSKNNPKSSLQSSFIAASTVLSEQPLTLKKCIVGKNVRVGGGVKANGCIINDGAVIEDGAQLVDCIVSEGAVIGRDSVLVGCKIAPRFVLPPNTEAKNELLAVEREEEL